MTTENNTNELAKSHGAMTPAERREALLTRARERKANGEVPRRQSALEIELFETLVMATNIADRAHRHTSAGKAGDAVIAAVFQELMRRAENE